MEAKNDTYTFKVMHIAEGYARPVLASFPQNIPDKKDETSFEMLRKRKISELRSTDSIIPLSGKYKPHLDGSKFLLGFVDEEKKKVDLVEIEQTFEIFRHLKNDLKSELVGLNSNVEGFEHREMIVQEIGTKKGKKILQQLKNKVIKEDTIFSANEIKDLMFRKAEDIQNEIDQNEVGHFQKELERKKEILPEFNYSAKSASKIYNLDSLMPPHEVSKLNPALADNEKFLLHFTKELKANVNWRGITEEQTKHKRLLLCYLNCLMIFYKMRRIDVPIQEVASHQKLPVEVAKGIVDRFYEPLKKEVGGIVFTRSKKQDTKLACFIVIAALSVSNYRIDVDKLTQALKLDYERLAMICREVGCNLTVDSTDHRFAVLKKLRIEMVDKFQRKN